MKLTLVGAAINDGIKMLFALIFSKMNEGKYIRKPRFHVLGESNILLYATTCARLVFVRMLA